MRQTPKLNILLTPNQAMVLRPAAATVPTLDRIVLQPYLVPPNTPPVPGIVRQNRTILLGMVSLHPPKRPPGFPLERRAPDLIFLFFSLIPCLNV